MANWKDYPMYNRKSSDVVRLESKVLYLPSVVVDKTKIRDWKRVKLSYDSENGLIRIKKMDDVSRNLKLWGIYGNALAVSVAGFRKHFDITKSPLYYNAKREGDSVILIPIQPE